MSMNLSKIEQLYTENIEKFGLDSRSVGWSTPESQQMRFEKLLTVIDNPQEPFTINELGCGYGELFKYCKDHHYSLTQFNGYDISEKMLEAAKLYINSNDAILYKASSISTYADYTITSGIFNVKFDTNSKSWEDFIKQTLANMFEYSNKGIAFNLLTKYVDFEAENLYYADPAFFFDYCKRELSKYVSLLHDYNLYEWTIVVKK